MIDIKEIRKNAQENIGMPYAMTVIKLLDESEERRRNQVKLMRLLDAARVDLDSWEMGLSKPLRDAIKGCANVKSEGDK